MYCIAERVVLPPLSEEERSALLEKAALVSVCEILDAVPDPRGKHGLRYELSFLLTCLLAARLSNCNSTEAVAQWCREHVEHLRQIFGPRLFLVPSGSLSRKLLPRLDAQAKRCWDAGSRPRCMQLSMSPSPWMARRYAGRERMNRPHRICCRFVRTRGRKPSSRCG